MARVEKTRIQRALSPKTLFSEIRFQQRRLRKQRLQAKLATKPTIPPVDADCVTTPDIGKNAIIAHEEYIANLYLNRAPGDTTPRGDRPGTKIKIPLPKRRTIERP